MIDSPAPLLRVEGLRKAYGDCVSNDSVSFAVKGGTIHGILGENGAGKSTAMKIVAGLVQPDQGEIWVRGEKVRISSPRAAKALGIGMVHQHFMLSEPQTALENIVLGQEPSKPRSRWLPRILQVTDYEAARSKLEGIMRTYGFDVPLDAVIDDLPLAQRQRVEILKLLYTEADLLIFDEPTAILTPPEVAVFFERLKALRDNGKTIIIVTHKLKELMAITRAVTILRAGLVITTIQTAESSPDELARLMIGEKLEAARKAPRDHSQAASGLSWRGVTLREGKRPIDLEVKRGEILGIAGIEGHGQDELVEAIRHPRGFFARGRGGSVTLLGQDVSGKRAEDMTRSGVGCIPGDRHRLGLLLEKPAFQNYALGHESQPAFRRGPFLRWRAIKEATKRGMERCDVQPRNLDLLAARFSGGNQQKLIFARETEANPQVLIAVHPTRGVDAGAIAKLHRQLITMNEAGLTVLLISSELDEILALSDRIAVLEDYSITRIFQANEVDETALGLAMSGSHAKARGEA